MSVHGGDAGRSSTTQGGDAVQVLQSGSMAVFTGGEIVAGKGCSREICGVDNSNGNAVKVIMGEVVIMGGRFDGDFYNLQGVIRLFGCVELRDDGRSIGGVLSDGSEIDVVYVGEEEGLEIEFDESMCPANDVVDPTASSSAGAGAASGVGSKWKRRASLLVMAILVMAMS